MPNARASRCLLLAVSTIVAIGCAGGPRERPIPTTEIQSGAGNLDAARKFLEGRWTLVSFEVFPPGAQPIQVPGSGVMTYDDFGNMKIDIRTDRAVADRLLGVGIVSNDGVISSEGRTAINLQNRTLTYVIEGQPAGGAQVGPLALSRPRHWQVDGDTLTISTKDDSGKDLSVGKWKKSGDGR
jgi:hypothetical protein